MHLERLGTDAVQDIDLGTCHVFPKVDGTNASVWFNDGTIQCGSRNRHLSIEEDNAGFCNWAMTNKELIALTTANPDLVFYGEWLVPHSVKTYREDAWRRFYIFDVYNRIEEKFVHYNDYQPLLDAAGVDYVPCIMVATNPEIESLHRAAAENKYLIAENSGIGEGIVIKQYGYVNKFGHTVWAKLISNQFKEAHVKELGGVVVNNKLIEEEIAEEFVTKHLVDKSLAKLQQSPDGFTSKRIPALLGMVFYDLITEELWDILKKHKNPRIDFKNLNVFTIKRIKVLLPEIF